MADVNEPGQEKRVRRWFRREGRRFAATQSFPWFRAGYYAALDDIERRGLWSTTDETRRESADTALKRWIEGSS